MDYSAHRPQGHEGQGDSYLPKIVRRLWRVLAETQDDLAHDTLRLPSEALGDLAGILVDFAEDLLEEKDGLGVFLNPDEGKEIMSGFTPLLAGLRKKGEGLTEEEEEVIRGFFDSEAISPKFVRRVLAEHVDESVKAAFLLKGDLPGYWLDYLLRSRKGHFYRKRYPLRRRPLPSANPHSDRRRLGRPCETNGSPN